MKLRGSPLKFLPRSVWRCPWQGNVGGRCPESSLLSLLIACSHGYHLSFHLPCPLDLEASSESGMFLSWSPISPPSGCLRGRRQAWHHYTRGLHSNTISQGCTLPHNSFLSPPEAALSLLSLPRDASGHRRRARTCKTQFHLISTPAMLLPFDMPACSSVRMRAWVPREPLSSQTLLTD